MNQVSVPRATATSAASTRTITKAWSTATSLRALRRHDLLAVKNEIRSRRPCRDPGDAPERKRGRLSPRSARPCCRRLGAPAAAAPAAVVSLPWPPSCASDDASAPPRRRGRYPLSPCSSASWLPRTFVGLEPTTTPDGSGPPEDRVKALGNYVFAVLLPSLRACPARGRESPPGRRAESDSLAGVLAGRRCGRLGRPSAGRQRGRFAVRVRVTTEVDGSRLGPGEKRSGDMQVTLTVENVTPVTAKSLRPSPIPSSWRGSRRDPVGDPADVSSEGERPYPVPTTRVKARGVAGRRHPTFAPARAWCA